MKASCMGSYRRSMYLPNWSAALAIFNMANQKMASAINPRRQNTAAVSNSWPLGSWPIRSDRMLVIKNGIGNPLPVPPKNPEPQDPDRITVAKVVMIAIINMCFCFILNVW